MTATRRPKGSQERARWRARLASSVVLAVCLWGCDRGDADVVPAIPASASPIPTATAVDYADEDLPVIPDFEAEADQEITADNYQEVLAEIEEELGEKRDAGADGGAADAGTDAGASSADAGRPHPAAPPKSTAKP